MPNNPKLQVSRISNHAIKRMRERTVHNEWVSRELISTALECGRRSCEFTGKEKDWLRDKERNYGNYAAIHAGMCFIFSPEMNCITVIRLPNWFEKKRIERVIASNKKMPIKKVKKYYRMHSDDLDDGDDGIGLAYA